MPVVITTYNPGDTVSATTLRSQLQQVETYVNEQIAQADRAADWMTANHVYRPDFYGAPNLHTTLTTGESYFRTRPLAEERRAFFSYYLGNGPYTIPGLSATVQIPEALNPGGTRYRLVVAASFYAFEFGGNDGNFMDEDNGVHAATFDLTINGTPARTNSCQRLIYKGSRTAADQAVPIYPRHQVSMVWGDTSAPVAQVGLNNIAVTVDPITPNPPTDFVKHIIIVQGNLLARYFIR